MSDNRLHEMTELPEEKSSLVYIINLPGDFGCMVRTFMGYFIDGDFFDEVGGLMSDHGEGWKWLYHEDINNVSEKK